MKTFKKILIGFALALAIIIGIGWWVLNQKDEKSQALFHYIPSDQNVGRINSSEALKMVLSLDFDSLKSRKKSKWSLLFTDSTKTGIDFLVNPWLFGKIKEPNMAFILNSKEDFTQWMKDIGSKPQILKVGDETIQCYYEESLGVAFCTNETGVALASLSSQWEQIATDFYSPKSSSRTDFSLGDELLHVKLEEPLKLMEGFVLTDSSLKLKIDERMLAVNPMDIPALPYDLLGSMALEPSQFESIKENKSAAALLKIMGIYTLKVEAPFQWSIALADTIVIKSKIISYGYDENFNKVEKVKWQSKVLPNIRLQFQFESEAVANNFYQSNQLKQYKNSNWMVGINGSKVLFYSASIPEYLDIDSKNILYIDMDALKSTIEISPMLSFVPVKRLGELEKIYLEQMEGKSSLNVKTKQHPVQWMFNLYNYE